MPLETATTIMDLNAAWPLGSDSKSEGDNHLRMIKAVLQAAFPVGSVVYNTTGTNPGTYIGGTWVATSEGRAIVGAGNNGESDWVGGEVRGTETVVLQSSEIPDVSLDYQVKEETLRADFSIRRRDSGNITSAGQNVTRTSGSSNQKVEDAFNNGSMDKLNFTLDHSHELELKNPAALTSQGHANVQPSQAVFVWERTA